MHFKEESIFYLFSKFHPDRFKFSVIIWLSKFTPDFWSRLPAFIITLTAWTILVDGHQSNIPAKLHWTQSNGFLREDF